MLKIVIKVLIFLTTFYSLITYVFSYESRYDSIGPEAIVNNKRLYQKYFACIVKNGKCTPDAKFIKDKIGDALPSLCIRCNPTQKIFADTLVAFMIESRPDDYDQMEKLYDPKQLYRQDLKKRKIIK